MTDLSKVPSELRRILLDFTISCLLEKPKDFVEYGCQYFEKLRSCRKVVEVEKEEDEVESRVDMKVMAARRASVFAERYNPDEDSDDSVRSIKIAKTDIERKKLADDIKGVLIFRSLDREELSSIMDAMDQRVVVENELIIQQGEADAQHFYVIKEGTFEASVTYDSGETKVVRTYSNSGSFGELALLYNVPRAASVRAITPGRLWTLDRLTFRKIVLKSAYRKRERYQKLIESVEFLKELDSYEKLDLADSLIPKYFSDGEEVFHQGDEADGMYFIESGGVQCVVEHPVHGKIVVRDLEAGDYLGELALLTHNRRALTANSAGETKLAFLDKDTFERLLGPCTEVLSRNFANYEAQMTHAVGSATSVYYRSSIPDGDD